MSDDSSGAETGSESREQGVEFGGLIEPLDGHDYPATQEQLAEAYGDGRPDLADGEEQLSGVLASERRRRNRTASNTSRPATSTRRSATR